VDILWHACVELVIALQREMRKMPRLPCLAGFLARSDGGWSPNSATGDNAIYLCTVDQPRISKLEQNQRRMGGTLAAARWGPGS